MKNAVCAQVAASGLEPHKPARGGAVYTELLCGGRSTYGLKASESTTENNPREARPLGAKAEPAAEGSGRLGDMIWGTKLLLNRCAGDSRSAARIVT